MSNFSITSIAKDLKDKKISATELIQDLVPTLHHMQKKLNCFISIIEEKALEQAKLADQIIQKNIDHPSLTGIPIAHKDIVCTKGTLTTCASKMLANFIPHYDAELVTNLKNTGAITIGKTNMDEFAMGSSNENSFYGPTLNPWDLSRVPGGSSGGSAAIVATGLIPGATGTDTGGSIRQPASLCGVCGIKPTYGRVSRFGVIAFASSLDQAGAFANSAEDLAIILQAMAGFDHKDSTSINQQVPDYPKLIQKPLPNYKIGLIEDSLNQCDQDVANKMQEFIKCLESLGCEIKIIKMPRAHLIVPAYYIIAPAECSSNLARYDGIKFGHRCKEYSSLKEFYQQTRSEGFGKEVQRRIVLGTFTLSTGYHKQYYDKAQNIRTLIKQDFALAFEQVDCILSPTSPTTAFKLNDKTSDPVKMYNSDIFTIGANLAGLPALSIPIGFSANNLPIGGQLIGKHLDETTLLQLAHYYQKETNWHKRKPTLDDK